jgi:hypothetical protein
MTEIVAGRDLWDWLLLLGGMIVVWTGIVVGIARLALIPWLTQHGIALGKDVDALGAKVNRQDGDLDMLSERTRSTDHRLDRHADAVKDLRDFTEKNLIKPIDALTANVQAMREEQAVIREKTDAQAQDIAEIRKYMRE